MRAPIPVSILGQMSATTAVSGSEMEALAVRAARVNRAQAGAEQLTEEAVEFVEDLARRFGSAGAAPAPADTHDEILFYRALTDAQ